MNESDPSSPFDKVQKRLQRKQSAVRGAIIAGCYVGAMLTVTMLGALVVANRVPSLERYAFERNAACSALFGLIMLLPVLRFLNRPAKMFVTAMTGWAILTAAYDFAGIYFRNLFNALQRSPFEVLIEGTIAYGVIAVAAWVFAMILHARRHSLAPVRRTRPGTMSSHR